MLEGPTIEEVLTEAENEFQAHEDLELVVAFHNRFQIFSCKDWDRERMHQELEKAYLSESGLPIGFIWNEPRLTSKPLEWFPDEHLPRIKGLLSELLKKYGEDRGRGGGASQFPINPANN